MLYAILSWAIRVKYKFNIGNVSTLFSNIQYRFNHIHLRRSMICSLSVKIQKINKETITNLKIKKY